MTSLVLGLLCTVLVTKVLSVASNSSTPEEPITKKVRRNKTIQDLTTSAGLTTSEEFFNCESIFPKIVKHDEITTFPLTNEARANLSFEMPETGIISVARDSPCVQFYSAYPTVTKIITDTMSNSSLKALERWKERMIKALGQEKFALMKEGQLNRGIEFHENIHRLLLGQGLKSNASDVVATSIKSLEHIWPLISSVVAIESNIVHPRLGYKGIADCVCVFRGIPVLIEWKLSDKLKPHLQDTYDAPVQLSAYLGAVNYDLNFKFQVNHGLVVIAYTSGIPADAFFMKPKVCEYYWKMWLRRLKKFNALRKRKPSLEETPVELELL